MNESTQPFLDKYSLIHLSLGILLYFARISFWLATLAHITVCLLYNNDDGYSVIRKFAPWWPGNKRPDSAFNIAGDSVSFMSGWLLASGVDTLTCPAEKEKKWYEAYSGIHN